MYLLMIMLMGCQFYFQNPHNNGVNLVWMINTLCMLMLINLYYGMNKWCKRCWMNYFACRTKVLHVIKMNAIPNFILFWCYIK